MSGPSEPVKIVLEGQNCEDFLGLIQHMNFDIPVNVDWEIYAENLLEQFCNEQGMTAPALAQFRVAVPREEFYRHYNLLTDEQKRLYMKFFFFLMNLVDHLRKFKVE